jgi:TonB family protein
VTSIHAVLHRLTKSLILGVLVFGLWTANLRAQQPATGITTGGKVASLSKDDIITRPALDYPYEDRRNYHQGRGLYRVTLDPKTGWARNVTVLKSTGWTSLDNAVVRGLRELGMKPGKWKQVDFPVIYEMARSREEAMEKMRRRQAPNPR